MFIKLKSQASIFIVTSLLIVLNQIGFAQTAYRHPSESSKQAANRSKFYYDLRKSATNWFQQQDQQIFDSAYDQSYKLSEINLDLIPELEDEVVVHNFFKLIRDERLLKSKQVDFLRRATWLFPDDGCFNRAALAAGVLKLNKNFEPAKLFIFGDLKTSSPNASHKFVTWWYHVVIAVRVKNQIYAFDPAVESQRPLKMEEWIEKINENHDKNLKFNVCPHNTYTPYDICRPGKEMSFLDLERDSISLLKSEFERIESLGRDPIKELGDLPPWLSEQGNQVLN